MLAQSVSPGEPLSLPSGLAPTARIDISNVLLNGELDTRDSDLYPRSGRYAQAEALIARQELGSDDDYNSVELNLRADFAWGRDDSTFTLAVGEAF